MKWTIAILNALVACVISASAVRAEESSGDFVRNVDGSRDCTRLRASGNPDYPPYLWKSLDGTTLEGAAADFIIRVGELAGVRIDVIHSGTWGRVQQLMREGSIDLIAGAFLTVPRMEYMDYFYPSFWQTRTVIWTQGKLDLAYDEWSDLVGIDGLTVIGNSFGQRFDVYAERNLTIHQVPSLEQGLQMLSLGRAEYLIYEELPGKVIADHSGIDDIRSYDIPVTTESLYITMAHNSPCNTDALRQRISQAIFKLVGDDVLDDMLDASIHRWGGRTN